MSAREGKVRKRATDSSPGQGGKSVVEEMVQHVVSFASPKLYRMELVEFGTKVKCTCSNCFVQVGVCEAPKYGKGSVFTDELDCFRACVVENHRELGDVFSMDSDSDLGDCVTEITDTFQSIWPKEDEETLKSYLRDESSGFGLFMLESIRRLTGEQELKDIFEYVRILPEDSLNIICNFQSELLSLLFKCDGPLQEFVQITNSYDYKDHPIDIAPRLQMSRSNPKIWKPKVLNFQVYTFEGWAETKTKA